MNRSIRQIKVFAVILTIVGMGLYWGLSSVAAHEGHSHAPAYAKKLKSPIQGSQEDLDHGKAFYSQFCGSCHGSDGKAENAPPMKVKPADLTDHHVHMLTEGEIYWEVTHGIAGSGMPACKTKMTVTQRWQVVAYVRTLGKM